MMEFEEPIPIPEIDAALLTPILREVLWMQFDQMKGKRIKLHWGMFRPSFKISVLEPLIIKLIGQRV